MDGGLLHMAQPASRFTETLANEMTVVNEGGCGGQIHRVQRGGQGDWRCYHY
jgi:hypothetical protein